MKRSVRTQVLKFKPLLELIASSSPQQRKILLQTLNEDAVDFICQCLYNTLHNLHSKMDPQEREHLKTSVAKDKAKLRRVCRHNLDTKTRQKILTQAGGSLGLIISAAIPIITSLLGR